MTFRIDRPESGEVEGEPEIAARVGGERVWIRLPAGHTPVLRGEPFLAAALVPAMVRGEPIEVDPELPVCPAFLAGTIEFMRVFRFWSRELKLDLRQVPVNAATSPAPNTEGTAVLFSGGIDGTWTFLEQPDPPSVGVFIHGIDFQLDNPSSNEAAANCRSWLAARGVPLAEVRTNIRFVGHRLGIGWNSHNGPSLAGISHALGVARSLIASGNSWHWTIGSGTHVASDALLSSSSCEVIHHGHGPTRWQKLERIAREPGVLEMLRVCWQDKGYNCGECDKCHRTMLLLDLLGLESPTFPTRAAEDLIPRRNVDKDTMYYAKQALALANDRGRDRVARILSRRIARWEWLELGKRFDRAFLGDAIRRGKSMMTSRGTPTPPE